MLQIFPSGPLKTNAYLVWCETTSQALLIDAPLECFNRVQEVLQKKKLSLNKLLLTHSHWDHIGDCSHFVKAFDIEVYVHPLDLENLLTPGIDRIPCPFPLEGLVAEQTHEASGKIQLGDLCFEVIHTPGHTPGGVCYYEEKKQWLFAGDTLFKGSIGLIEIPTGDRTAMRDSLKKIQLLPEDTEVYPGHGKATTLGKETWLAQADQIFKLC